MNARPATPATEPPAIAPVDAWDTVVSDVAAEGCDEEVEVEEVAAPDKVVEVEVDDSEVVEEEVEDSDVVLGKAELAALDVVEDTVSELVGEEEAASQPPTLYWQSSA